VLGSDIHRLAYILAGGRSSRFGSNKALVPIDGEPLILRLRRQMEQAGLTVSIVSQTTSDYSNLGVRTIRDGVPHAGPLVGMIAALQDCLMHGQAWCIVSCCDMLDWHKEWAIGLESARQATENAKLISLAGNSFLPFPCLVCTDLLGMAEKLMTSEKPSMKAFFARVGEFADRCKTPPERVPLGFNTPEELERLLRDRLHRPTGS
jgi:molybdenum cofactor guanylyltransferase